MRSATALLAILAAACAASLVRADDGAAGAAKDAASEVSPAMHEPPAGGLFFEDFQAESMSFSRSADPKYANQPAEVRSPRAEPAGLEGDRHLEMTAEARHYGLVAPMRRAFDPSDDEELVFQYELRLQNGLSCGGAYMKMLIDPATAEDAEDADVGVDAFLTRDLSDPSLYGIMFGPDRCGSNDRIHFIVRQKNPETQEWVEHHMQSPPTTPTDTNTHLLTLVVRRDNTFSVLVDGAAVRTGSLTSDSDFAPPFQPAEEIDDPTDSKPADWVDEAKIPDPEASKPEDWDEDAPLMIPDTSATKPEDWLEDEPAMVADPAAEMPDEWDEEEDGEWEAPLIENPRCNEVSGCGKWEQPMIRNPEYKGKWSPPMIDNPEYKGEWAPRRIANPGYFANPDPYTRLPRLSALAIDIWTMTGGIAFDNIFVGTSEATAIAFAEATWRLENTLQSEALEAKARAAAAEDRRKRWQSDDWKDWVAVVIEEIAVVVTDNWLVSVGLFTVLVVVSFTFCCGGSSDDYATGAPEASEGFGADEAEYEGDFEGEEDEGADEEAEDEDGDEAGAAAAGAAVDEDGEEEAPVKAVDASEHPSYASVVSGDAAMGQGQLRSRKGRGRKTRQE